MRVDGDQLAPNLCRKSVIRMIHQRYFKPGQKVLLRPNETTTPNGYAGLLSGYIHSGGHDFFDLTLPYGPDSAIQYPFHTDMNFEISSESLGLGARVSGTFDKILSGDRIRMHILPDLQMFQRRAKPRIDCRIGLRFTRGRGSLKAMRQTWEKNVEILNSSKQLPALKGFRDCNVNLSCGGIRFALKPPAEPADLCLLLLDLQDEAAPICALSEIIWTLPDRDGQALLAGMQFLNLLENDRKRLSNFTGKNGQNHRQ